MPTTTETTAAAALMSSPSISEGIESVVRELEEVRAGITGVRTARADLKQSYQSSLQQLAEWKGRPAVFPYVGSGMGNGALVELADGSVKWDMITGIGVHAFGHSDPELVGVALRAALGDTVQQGNLMFNADSIAFGSLLVAEASRGGATRMAHCFLTNSGCMANESALKVCFQKKPGANRVLAFADCFTGRSVTMAQIGDSAAGRQGIPLNMQVDYIPFYDEDEGAVSIEQAVRRLQEAIARYPGQHACFVMELAQGEGGFNTAPREFFIALMDACKAAGIPIWIDEVQTFGRTERMFYTHALDVGAYADVITVGKLSQVCACLFTAEMNPKPGLLSGTFVGGTVELQVGRRIIERLRDGGYYGPNGLIAQLHAAFREHAQRFISAHPEWFGPVKSVHSGRTMSRLFGGVGGMMRLTPFGGDRAMITKALNVMFEEGVIAFYCGHGPYHVRFLPPVGVMQPEQFDDVFRIMERAFARV